MKLHASMSTHAQIARPARLAMLSCLVFAAAAQANMQITEFMYTGNGPTGEFVEFTNLGLSPVDFTGWSFDDDSRVAGTVSLSAFGIVAPGQSVILAEAASALFVSTWNLGANVRVIGSNTTNLGRADEINLFNASGVLVDRLTYGDVAFPGTVRAQNFSAGPLTQTELTPFTITSGWVLASAGDAFGSYGSSLGDIGNPGIFTAPIPEPSSIALMLAGIGLLAAAARRRA